MGGRGLQSNHQARRLDDDNVFSGALAAQLLSSDSLFSNNVWETQYFEIKKIVRIQTASNRRKVVLWAFTEQQDEVAC